MAFASSSCFLFEPAQHDVEHVRELLELVAGVDVAADRKVALAHAFGVAAQHPHRGQDDAGGDEVEHRDGQQTREEPGRDEGDAVDGLLAGGLVVTQLDKQHPAQRVGHPGGGQAGVEGRLQAVEVRGANRAGVAVEGAAPGVAGAVEALVFRGDGLEAFDRVGEEGVVPGLSEKLVFVHQREHHPGFGRRGGRVRRPGGWGRRR